MRKKVTAKRHFAKNITERHFSGKSRRQFPGWKESVNRL
jgi:hypothetical protein